VKLAPVRVGVSPTVKPRIPKRYGVPFREAEAALCVRAADGTRPARKRQSVFADRHGAKRSELLGRASPVRNFALYSVKGLYTPGR